MYYEELEDMTIFPRDTDNNRDFIFVRKFSEIAFEKLCLQHQDKRGRMILQLYKLEEDNK